MLEKMPNKFLKKQKALKLKSDKFIVLIWKKGSGNLTHTKHIKGKWGRKKQLVTYKTSLCKWERWDKGKAMIGCCRELLDGDGS